MNRLEKIAISVRHTPGLDNAEWLWRRVRPAYDRMLRRLGSHKGLERTINGVDRIRLSPLSRGFVDENYEPQVWNRVMREVRPGDRIAEVGAHIGLYSLAFARRAAAGGHVVAFEPEPDNAQTLEANIAVNGWQDRITVVRAAVGDRCASVRFAANFGCESHVLRGDEASQSALEVPMVTLDSYFPDAKIDLLKIDVEGFEELVLRGGSSLLADKRRRPRLILIEVHPFAWEAVGTSSDSLLGRLRECGYGVETVAGIAVTRIVDYGHVVAIPG